MTETLEKAVDYFIEGAAISTVTGIIGTTTCFATLIAKANHYLNEPTLSYMFKAGETAVFLGVAGLCTLAFGDLIESLYFTYRNSRNTEV